MKDGTHLILDLKECKKLEKLSNKKFIEKAPKEAIEQAKTQRKDFSDKIKIITERIKSL